MDYPNLQQAARARQARTGEKYTLALSRVIAERAALDSVALGPIADSQHAAALADSIIISIHPGLAADVEERIRTALIPAFTAAGYPEQATRVTYALNAPTVTPDHDESIECDRYVDTDALRDYIVANTGLTRETVQTVLDVEHEYMVALGLIESLDPDEPVEWHYYDSTTAPGPGNFVDDRIIARDVERFTGIPFSTARDVLGWSGEYLITAGQW